MIKGDIINERLDDDDDGDPSGRRRTEESTNKLTNQKDATTECEIRDEELRQQLERLWKTEFENTEVETNVCALVEDKSALARNYGRDSAAIHGHPQVALPSCDTTYHTYQTTRRWQSKEPYM